MLGLSVLKFSVVLFCFFAYGMEFSKPIDIEFEICEICCDEKNIAVSSKFGIFLVQYDGVFKPLLEKKFVVAPKIALHKDRVFFNSEDMKFCALDFDGNVIFERNLEAVSRSNIFVSDENVFFSLTNQFLLCYSRDGNLIWVNREFYTVDQIVKNNLIVNNNDMLFMFIGGAAILEKKSGLCHAKFKEFKHATNFYLSKGNLNSNCLDETIALNLDIKKFKKYGKNIIISNDVEYFYDESEIRNLKTGVVVLKDVEIKNFKFYEDKIFAYKENLLIVIDGDNFIVQKLNFDIKDLFYKNGKVIVSDGRSIRWADYS